MGILGQVFIVFHIRTGKSPGLITSARQYGVENRIVDLCTFDITRNPLRCGQMFDAIVTDPPCERTLLFS